MPPGLKAWIRWPLDMSIEIAERMAGARDDLTPPYRLRRRFASTLSSQESLLSNLESSDTENSGEKFKLYKLCYRHSESHSQCQ